MIAVDSLFWILPATFCLFAAAFAIIALREPSARHCRWWVAGFVLAAIGTLLDIEGRNYMAALPSLAVPVHFLTLLCCVEALLARHGDSIGAKNAAAAFLVGCSVHAALVLNEAGISSRVTNVTAMATIIIGLGVRHLSSRRATGVDRTIFWLMAGLVVSYAVRFVLFVVAGQADEFHPLYSGAMPAWSQYNLVFYMVNGFFAIAVALAAMLATGMDLVAARHAEAGIDGLTGIANRRTVAGWIEQDISGNPGHDAVVMIDIDHFKALNDTHGHAAGDAVLVAVARALSDSLSAFGDIARLGGEEFGLFIHTAQARAAAQLAIAARVAVATARPEAPFAMLGVTASVGVALRDADEPLEAVMRRADVALYEAKASGRDRVVMAAARQTQDRADQRRVA